ncbi:rhombosortase [Salinibius halmophilus]|uniref:rhombosortase n=1 Tax=Salinibius halmophilus TaxID=1853216 RepID=UPI001314C40D|nr:rhombosortase [Salinibius halmophilus]
MTLVKQYFGWGLLVLLMAIVELPFLQLKQYFYFDQQYVELGQVWRIVTTHLVHMNLTHFAMNFLGLAIIAWVGPRWLTDWRALPFNLWLFLLVGYGIWEVAKADPAFNAYFGFSGVLYGWLVVALAFAPNYSIPIRILAAGFISAKVLLEQIPGFSFVATDAAIGAPVMVQAHLFGLLGAIIVMPILWRLFIKPARATPQ